MRRRPGPQGGASSPSPTKGAPQPDAAAPGTFARTPWQPPVMVAIYVLVAVRALGAMYQPISDCDETYNYWEPTHYLIEGFGMQTWEYSPVYALRSYSYLLPLSWIGKVLKLFLSNDKVALFYALRLVLALAGACSEVSLYTALYVRFPCSYIPATSLLFLVASPGMFLASAAYLPSTFSMVCLTFAFSFYIRGWTGWTIFMVGVAGLIGWPFCGVVIVPLAIDLLRRERFGFILVAGVMSAASIMGFMYVADLGYYRTPVFAVWNLIVYNTVGGPAGGSDLYGVEPWTFYVLNLLANFHVITLLAALSPLLFFIPAFRASCSGYVHYYWHMVLGVFLWMAFMFALPHKEERFLFVVYPLICVAAAGTASMLLTWLFQLGAWLRGGSEHEEQTVTSSIVAAAAIWIILVSAARINGQVTYFNAPLTVYEELYRAELMPMASSVKSDINVCVGKEWYRFPASFFLPSARFRLRFLKSGFSGQLPQPYAAVNGTSVVPNHMNDGNVEEPTRYIKSVAQCHYIIDRDDPAQSETHYLGLNGWSTVAESKFLDSARSSRIGRIMRLPFWSEQYVAFNPYVVLKNNALFPSLDKSFPKAVNNEEYVYLDQQEE